MARKHLSDETIPTIRGIDPLTAVIVMGKAGALASAADVADFPIILPYNFQPLKLKALCKTAPTTAMVLTLRQAADPTAYLNSTVSAYSNVGGTHVLTWNANDMGAIASPSLVTLLENDILNFSLASASGSDLMFEIIGRISA